MSILSTAPLGVAPPDSAIGSIYIMAAIVALLAAFATGLLRKNAVSGPSRLPASDRAAWRLLFALACGFMMWITVQIIYGGFMQLRTGPSTRTVASTQLTFSPLDWAFLSTVPYAIGFLTLLTTDAFLLDGAAGIERLGLRSHPLGGAMRGVVGILIAWPMVQIVSAVSEQAYDRFHFVHPQEHELLKALGESGNPAVRIALIVGAVIFAPLFEEYVFRAHIQTFLREMLIRATRPRKETVEPQTGDIPDSRTLAYAVPGRTAWEAPRSIAWPTWVAIFIASAIFTSVHPRWMWPPIFFLAICLGYAYERTGNLWTTIVMHSLFNAINTAAYLSLGHG